MGSSRRWARFNAERCRPRCRSTPIGKLGVEACLAAAGGKSLPGHVEAPIQVVTKRNVARAQERFPQPVEPFESPFAALLGG
jgi:hypothetical protein